MDQTHSVADDVNKILSAVESLSNPVKDLSARVQRVEKELQEIQKIQKEEDIVPQDEKPEFDPKEHLPPFPETFDSNGFREWVDAVESVFLKCHISKYEQVDLVARTLPSEELKRWEGMERLCCKIDRYTPIYWGEMKKMIMVRFLYQDCPGTNEDKSVSSS